MKHLPGPLWLAAIALLAIGCHSADKPSAPDLSALFGRPPFAAITDSINRFPNDPLLYLRRAELLSQTENYAVAEADYRKAWTLAPSEETGTPLAANLAIQGKHNERMKFLTAAIAKIPASRDLRRLMGEAYAESGRNQDALRLYDSMIALDSADFETWYEKGLLLETLKDTATARAALEKAYTLQPVQTFGLELAHLYAESKDPRALDITADVLRSDTEHHLPDPFFIRGIYYSNTGNYHKAIPEFDSCIHRDWKFVDAYIEKGIAQYKLKDYDTALHTFRLASTVSSINPDAYFWMGRCYEARNNKDEAALNYERAIALDREFTEAKEALRRVSGN